MLSVDQLPNELLSNMIRDEQLKGIHSLFNACMYKNDCCAKEAKAEQMKKALEEARHELTTLHGLVAADGAAPQETWVIDTNAVIAVIDQALNEALCTDPRLS